MTSPSIIRTLAGCELWDGDLNPDGYGRWGHQLAHRRMWEEYVGDIPEGMTVDHLCKNRSCVKVTHLQLVTQSENSKRRWGKGEVPWLEPR